MPSILNVLVWLCALSCVGYVVYRAVGLVGRINQFQTTSITLYSGSGILVKGFPGDTTRVVQIAADNSVKPQLQQCGDLSDQNEFFLSKAEINDSSDALKFDELQANASSGKMVGLWVCGPAFGDQVVFVPCRSAYIKDHPTLTVSASDDQLTLTSIPQHIGPVSLTAAGPSGDIQVPLTTNGNPDEASVEHSSADFRMLVKSNRPVFALSQWNGSVEFPILVKVNDVVEAIDANDTSEVSSSRASGPGLITVLSVFAAMLFGFVV
eukprot:151496_1